MNNLSLSLLITLLTSTLYAQNIGTINGVVKDKNTQEELIGVLLRFTGKDTVNTITGIPNWLQVSKRSPNFCSL
ncbi:MAG: hypothetical protein LCH32_09620 [Bacteroidetes bacterium]|nr:hypothetical protein [Bacteroidota bacterium]